MPNYQVSDSIYLDCHNIKTQRPSLKLNNKYLGLFKVLCKHSIFFFELNLLKNIKIYLVFYSNLL